MHFKIEQLRNACAREVLINYESPKKRYKLGTRNLFSISFSRYDLRRVGSKENFCLKNLLCRSVESTTSPYLCGCFRFVFQIRNFRRALVVLLRMFYGYDEETGRRGWNPIYNGAPCFVTLVIFEWSPVSETVSCRFVVNERLCCTCLMMLSIMVYLLFQGLSSWFGYTIVPRRFGLIDEGLRGRSGLPENYGQTT